MLNTRLDRIGSWKEHLDRPTAPEYDFRWMYQSISRFKWMVIAIAALMGGLSLAYVKLREPSYTASSLLQLTNLRLNFSREDAFFAETQSDPNFLETQIQLLRSAKIALSVVDTLKLSERPATGRGSAIVKYITDYIGEVLPASAPDEQSVTAGVSEARLTALKAIQRGFKAERVGLSNVVQIEFSWNNPVEAAQILNEISNAFIADQNASRIEAAQAASSWLRERLRDVGPKTRIIAPALTPTERSNTAARLVVPLAFVLGSGLGIMLALFRAFVDRRILTPQAASAATQTECLGVIPGLPGARIRPLQFDSEARKFTFDRSILTAASRTPGSLLARTLRNVAVASHDCVDGRGLKFIGITSITAGEGKTLVASNLAMSLAQGGRRVLLIDANSANPTLSAVATGNAAGLFDCLRDAKFADTVWRSDDGLLHLLPIGGNADQRLRQDLWPDTLEKLLATIKSKYDYVLFDLPPLEDFGPVRASTRFLEGYLLVVKSGSVTPDQIVARFGAAGGFYDRLFGCVLNKANLRHIRVFDPAHSPTKTRRSWFRFRRS
jgi:polysaccharide biosynthesis transport protein